MQPSTQSKEKIARVLVFLLTLIALVVVAVTFVGCSSDTNKNGSVERTVTGPTPSPTPTPSSTPKERLLPGDTIIVIRDGSVHMEVNKATLCNDEDLTNPDDRKYKCDKVPVELKEVAIQTIDGPMIVPAANGNSKITVNEGDNEIEIQGAGNHVKIKFKKAKYPEDSSLPGEHNSSTTTLHVGAVKLDSTVLKTCVPADRCEVFVRKKP